MCIVHAVNKLLSEHSAEVGNNLFAGETFCLAVAIGSGLHKAAGLIPNRHYICTFGKGRKNFLLILR